MLVDNFFDALQRDPLLTSKDYQAIHNVLLSLACLFALHLMEKDMAEFVICGYLDLQQCEWVKDQLMLMLEKIRPQAVPLVDAFDLPDYYLHSALGQRNGDVYKALVNMVEKEPLNQSVVVDGYESIIRPLVFGDSKL
jgi:acyl-CoA oxidase